MRFNLSCLLLILSISALVLTEKRHFVVSDIDYDLLIRGSMDGKKLSIEFKVAEKAASRSLMIFFKNKGQNCPGFLLMFSITRIMRKHAYLAAGCTGADGLGEPEMNDNLTFDFDREKDGVEGDMLVFKGTVEYQMDLNEFKYAELDTIKVRGQINDDRKIIFEKEYDWATK